MKNTSHPDTVNPEPLEKKHRGAMHTKILMGLLIGATGGIAGSLLFGARNTEFNWFIENITKPLGNLWLRLLLMIVIPLVFSALVLGVAGLGNIKKLGR